MSNEYENVAIYVRQSIYLPEGIDRQIAKCRQLIAMRGWAEGRLFQDNETSATKVRGKNTDWARMIAAMESGEITVVVAVDMDRLLRNLKDLLTLIDLDVKVATVDGEIDLTTADGEFRASIMASMARFETRRKSERQLRGNQFRIDNGKPVAGGRRRFGFETDHLTLVSEEVEWIHVMYQDMADGASLGSICRKMNAAGIRTVAESLRNGKQVLLPAKAQWNPARIRKILVNPAYRGQVIHHKQGIASDVIPVVIGPELASRVDAIMADPTRRKTAGNERSALMGGVALCGTCGAKLISAGTKSKGKPVKTYSCSRVKTGQTAHAGHPSIRREILDRAVRKAVVQAFMFGRHEIDRLSTKGSLSAIEASLATQYEDQASLTDFMVTHLITATVARPRLTKIKQEIDKLNGLRNQLVTEDAFAQMLVSTQRSFYSAGTKEWDEASALMTQITARFDSLELGMQRELIKALLEVAVDVGRGPTRVRIWHKVVTALNDDQILSE